MDQDQILWSTVEQFIHECSVSGRLISVSKTDLQTDFSPLHLILNQMILHLTATFMQSLISSAATNLCLPSQEFISGSK